MTTLNVVEYETVQVTDVASVVYAETPYWWEVKCESCPQDLRTPKRIWRPIDPGSHAADQPMRQVDYDAPGKMLCSECGFSKHCGVEVARSETLLRVQTVATNANGVHEEVRVNHGHTYTVYVNGWQVTSTKTEAGAMRRALRELALLEAA